MLQLAAKVIRFPGVLAAAALLVIIRMQFLAHRVWTRKTEDAILRAAAVEMQIKSEGIQAAIGGVPHPNADREPPVQQPDFPNKVVAA